MPAIRRSLSLPHWSRFALGVVIALTISTPAWGAKPGEADAPHASRLLVIVVDQLRADLVDRGHMTHIQRLRDAGASFDEAYVGHLASKTVVSHAVIPRGVFPRRMGWSDDCFRDVTGALGKPNGMYVAELPLGDLQKLLPAELPPSISTGFASHPRRVFIGEKDYAVAAMAGNDADIDITLGAVRAEDGASWKGWLKPVGLRVPDYVTGVPGSRFWLDGRPAYGTESASYALGGHKYIPGNDSAHLGGDVWTVDAAMAVMDHEDWGALFITLGGVDKVGHMMGASHDLDTPRQETVTFAEALRVADEQVGRILDKLAASGLARETLVVLTSDHGGMWSEHLHARNRPRLADMDWQWGRFERGLTFLDPQPEIAALVAEGGIDAVRSDTAVRVWATAGDPHAATIPARLAKLPGVIGVYRRVDAVAGDKTLAKSSYQPAFEDFSRAGAREKKWETDHAHELLDTMATPSAPDFVALLDEKTGYALPGDHGGAQEANQRIPLIFAGPGVRTGVHHGRARLVDVAPALWKLSGRKLPAGLDGSPLCAAIADCK